MSTIYAVFRRGLVPELDDCRCVLSMENYVEGEEYFPIARTSLFNYSCLALVSHLPDDTPVYALDNGTDIKTLGELKEYFNKWKNKS